MKLTGPQKRILGECIAGGARGAVVWGRNMAAVDRLRNMGLITVVWTIQGLHSAAQSRWHGIAHATTTGRKAHAGR